MTYQTFLQRSRIEATADEVFAWHTRPGAFERLTPPFEDVDIVEPAVVEPGGRAHLRVPMGPMKVSWIARIAEVTPGRGFRDEQVSGPFAHWVHNHRFLPQPDGACVLEDEIEYALPMGPLGAFFGGAYTREKLRQLFFDRHARTARDLSLHRSANLGALRIAITGATGLVGSSLIPFLTTGGHTVIPLSRRPLPAWPNAIRWDAEKGFADGIAGLDGIDAVVHLAGENIVGGAWTPERKRVLRASRIEGTRNLCEALAKLDRKPRVLVSASAVGYYGDPGDREVDESAPAGQGFLADISREWEDATQPARDAGIRVVTLRIGIVLSPKGGALAKMLTPFSWGVGGRLGTGRQYMSWISIDDLVGAIHHAIATPSVVGAVNATAPHPATNAEMTKTLARVLYRPVGPPVPNFALSGLYGHELADAVLLRGVRAVPRVLMESGYRFAHDDLEQALRAVLGRRRLGTAAVATPRSPEQATSAEGGAHGTR